MPAVSGKPLRRMPKLLYGYVVKASLPQQIPLCILTVMVFPLTLAPLELQRRIVDGAIEGGDVRLLAILGAIYLGAVVLMGLLKYIRNIYTEWVSEGVIRRLRHRIAGADGVDADDGTRQAILAAEAENVGGFVAEAIAFPLLQIGIIVSVIGYMLFVEPLMAIVAIVFLIPPTIVVAVSQPFLDKLSGRKIEAVRGLGEAALEKEGDDIRHLIGRIYVLRLRFARIKHAMKSINNLLAHLGPLSILLVGGWLAINGETEIGTIVAFISGYERMNGPARDMLNFYRRLSMMRVQYKLVYEAST